MQVKVTKTFTLAQPLRQVWEFLSDPAKVAHCVPGVQITEVVDQNRYLGTLSVRVGPVQTSYNGELTVERLDRRNFEIRLAGKGQDVKGKGSASARMAAKLAVPPQGGTLVSGSSEVTITGLLAQFGSRMIEEVADQMFGQFKQSLQKHLEDAPVAARESNPGGPLRAVPLLLHGFLKIILHFLRRLLWWRNVSQTG